METIFHRTSVRKFLEKPVEVKKIEKLLRAAMAAPSAGNQQPWEYFVVTNQEKLKELSQCSPYASCVQDAPLAIVACSRCQTKLPEYIDIDMAIATENILLEADALGLGAVMLGIAPIKERINQVNCILNLQDLNAFAIIACGYPVSLRPQQDRFDETRVHHIK